MLRGLASLVLAPALACGRASTIPDEQLGDLVVEPRRTEEPIDVDTAAKDPAMLGRALTRPHRSVSAALGPHAAQLATRNTVVENGKPVSTLDDKTAIELGEHGAYHAVYTNSADYGRETIFAGGKLYLRPRYQRWHERDPESPDEPALLRDRYFEAIAATWDLVAPAAELVDRGTVQVAGRAGRKIEVHRAPSPAAPPAERLAQRKWREGRTIDELTGEVILDAEKGVPLAVKLAGTVGFTRDGRRFAMKVGLDAAITGIGTAAAVAAPPRAEVVATPERMREVDERDFLLQGIAPPQRRGTDGSAAPPPPPAPAPKEGKP